MSINFPETPKEIDQRARTDVQRELPESNPFLKNSFLGALITGFSLRVFDFYTQLQELIKELFVQTATGDFLAMFGAWFGVTRNPSTQATGNVVATGTATSVIPLGAVLQSTDGKQYDTQLAATISTNVLAVTSLTRSGSTVTATTTSPHGLASLVNTTIADAVETEYNGTFSITVTGLNTFTYQIATTPTTPATGTITATATTASVPVKSIDFGQAVNQLAGAALTLLSPISGVDSEARVDFSELSGGTDTESDTDFRARVISRVQNPVALFNVNAIVNQAKLVAGVTRVFVFEITPAVGQVTIYFVRDNDANIIPSAGEVTTTKNKILEIKPAHTSDDDVIVAAPTAVPVAFTFTALSPNTSTMQTAITASLADLIANTGVGDDLLEDAYRSAIFKTIDRETGDIVVSFTLSTPTVDVTIAAGEIATLGTVTFS